jgi:hypothetical protein
MPRQKGTPKTGGRKKGSVNLASAEFKDVLRNEVPKALEVLKELLQSDSEQIQLAAAREIFDRVYGKAAQAIEVSGKDGADLKHVTEVVVRSRQEAEKVLAQLGSKNGTSLE